MKMANKLLGISALDKVTPVRTCDATHRKASLNNTLKVLIAFALVERSESDDISPTSSRSSKRSFDRNGDYLDLLRIHSVVQAFFIDSLHEKHQIPFWLERAVAVWARSYDEADRRIQDDPRVGLPDDYRRFCIHGEKLLQNLVKFERRYPKLGVARSHLEERLEKIQGQIDDLSHAIQKNIIDGSAEEYPASVFDRISTSSQSDAATVQSHSSRLSGMASLGDGDSELVQSPVMELLEHEALVDTPYPNTPVMPMVPEILDDDDQETVVLSIAGTQVHVGATDTLEVMSLPPDPTDRQQEAITYDDWHDAIPHHRVIKRQETRRYHDRAGAWRDKTISDPRVGLSWEVAVGSISSRRESSRSPLGARLTAQSEAEMELNKIKRAAPPSPKPRGESFGSQTAARPNTLLGRNSWALPQVVKTPDTDVAQIPPEEFFSGLPQILSSPKSWTEATIKMLKKKVLPSSKPTERPSQAQHPPEEDLMAPPTPIFRGSRSANSSPASNASPFPPPSFSGIPTEDLLTKPGAPLVVRRWDTVVYHPDGTPITSGGVEWASTSDPLSLSYPIIPSRPQLSGAMHPAQLMLRGGPPAGYSSQPMSRDGSHPSNPSISIKNSPVIKHSPPSRPPSPPVAERHSVSGGGAGTVTGSLPIPTRSRLTPFNHPSARPPSYTETEPSPRTDPPFFPDVDTSYQRWEQHHGLGITSGSFPPPTPAAAGAAAAVGGGVGGPPNNPDVSNGNGSPSKNSLANRLRRPGRGTRILRGVRDGNGKGKGKRAHSLSPVMGTSSASASASGSGSASPPVPWPLPRGRAQAPAQGPAQAVGGADGAGLGMGLGMGMGYGVQYHHPHHPLAEWSAPPAGGIATGAVVEEIHDEGSQGVGGSVLSAGGGAAAMSRSAPGGSNGATAAAAAAGIRMDDGTVVGFGTSPEGGFGSSSGSGSGSGSGTGFRGRGGGRKKLRRGSFPGMGTNGFVIRE